MGGGDGKEHPSDPQRACTQVKITLHYGTGVAEVNTPDVCFSGLL